MIPVIDNPIVAIGSMFGIDGFHSEKPMDIIDKESRSKYKNGKSWF